MRIIWNPNPLCTVIELDDADRWWLREAVLIDHDDGESSREWTNKMVTEYEAALHDAHEGDCTCVPCSCLKCHAEGYLGVDTMPGLRKYHAYKVNGAFENGRTLDDAIAALAAWDPKFSWRDTPQSRALWDSCLPRWREEAAEAHAWLVQYRDEHFGATKP